MKSKNALQYLFIALPLLEIAVFIWVGGIIGAGWTILLVIATTVIGSTLMRNQGFKMMNDFARNARMGRAEPSDIMEGSFIFIGGFLLIIPGFITDIIGFLCLIPGIRRWVVRCLVLAIAKKPTTATQHHTIEGEFTKRD